MVCSTVLSSSTWSRAFYLMILSTSFQLRWRLEASGGGVRAPGESVHLSCQGYGLRLAGVWWYRQAPGGHLKWLSDISTSSYVRSSPEVEGRVKGSRDDSRSIISLSLHNLRPEDSAHYFCAFHTGTGNPADL
uniref:Ig-like domain-containing protein n=1 Tax=Meleagris gallopavo TaxID=9103 RepID=G3UV16_MELGA